MQKWPRSCWTWRLGPRPRPLANSSLLLAAALYEKLASTSQRLSDAYLPMDLSAEDPNRDRAGNR